MTVRQTGLTPHLLYRETPELSLRISSRHTSVGIPSYSAALFSSIVRTVQFLYMPKSSRRPRVKGTVLCQNSGTRSVFLTETAEFKRLRWNNWTQNTHSKRTCGANSGGAGLFSAGGKRFCPPEATRTWRTPRGGSRTKFPPVAL